MNSLIKFIRTSDAVGREEEARLAADQELAIVDKGYFDRFLKEVWSADSVTSDSRESIKAGMAAARDLRGEVISRIPVRAVYAEYSPQYSATAGDYVLLIRDVRTSKNSAGREIVMLGMQNGSWKVVWFEYVS
jgi:hypothetical protein